MKKNLSFNPPIIYIFIICLVAIGEAFAIKSTAFPSTTSLKEYPLNKSAEPALNDKVFPLNEASRPDDIIVETDTIEFNVEVVQPRKFFLSFNKKREETFFIKIYDVIGNLIHHEVVSKKGKFRKQYDLSKYKTDLYVIEVGSGKKAMIKRLFLG